MLMYYFVITFSVFDIFQVELEGWVRLWEYPNGIPPADLSWVKDDTERGLFGPIQCIVTTPVYWRGVEY